MQLPNTPVWDDHPWAQLPALTGDVETDVCVVGLGGSGLTAVSELLALGAQVVGLEATQVGGGAAGRNGGLLLAGTAHFYHDAVAALGRERARRLYGLTLAELERIAIQTPRQVRQTGSLRIAGSVEEWDDAQKQLEAMKQDGFAAQPYDGPEGRGLLFPTDATVQPLARCRELADATQKARAKLFEHSPALTLSGNEVTTPQGRVHCHAVIVAVDGRLETLLPELQGRVRTARCRCWRPRRRRRPRCHARSTHAGGTNTTSSYRTGA